MSIPKVTKIPPPTKCPTGCSLTTRYFSIIEPAKIDKINAIIVPIIIPNEINFL